MLLTPILSIGMEQGDSCYVFGDVADACIGPDGSVYVLDGISLTVTRYAPDGSFEDRSGGPGEGPGEYGSPSGMTVLEDGRIAVSDQMLSRVTFLLPDLTVDTTVTGYSPWAPERIEAYGDGSFMGTHRTFDRERSLYGHVIAVWSDSTAPDRVVYSRVTGFSPARLRESTRATLAAFTADRDGTVFIAPVSETEFRVTALGPSGDTLYVIEEEREPRERPEEEIEEERQAMREQLGREGAPPDLQWEPAPMRSMITMAGLGADSLGRLWVRDGRETFPVFDVYAAGEHLFRAAADTAALGDGWTRVDVSPGGIVAWETDPELYPVVHVLSVE